MRRRLEERLLEAELREQFQSYQNCCKCCWTTLGLIITTILILANISTSPNCYMQDFEVSSNSSIINYELELNLKSRLEKGIYYDALNLSFYYKPNATTLVGIGDVVHPAFFQEGKEIDRFSGYVDASGVDFEDESRSTLTNNGSAVFRVDLSTRVRYSLLLWKTKRHDYAVGADLHVNGQGKLIKWKKDKAVALTSGAVTGKKNSYLHVLTMAAGIFAFLHFGYF